MADVIPTAQAGNSIQQVVVTSSDLIPKIQALATNPAAVQRLMISSVESASNGAVRIIDPSNPFVALMECGVTTATAAVIEADTVSRMLYSANALTEEDLYLHMADDDFVGIFGSPGKTTLALFISYDEFINKNVPLTDGTGVGKLTIPRFTEFNVGGMAFTMQYPIDIRLLSHGGISVTYDTSTRSPLQTLSTNQLEWKAVSVEGQQYVVINIPVFQMALASSIETLSATVGFNKIFTFQNTYYYCRAYIPKRGGGWTEIKVSYTQQVFDPAVPTVVVQVQTNRLIVNLPQIYFNNGTVSDALRIDIYTTKGPMNTDLKSYAYSNFTTRFLDYDNNVQSRYVAPLQSFNTYFVVGPNFVTGGANRVPFSQLRDVVVNRSQATAGIPINNTQLTFNLTQYGYDLVTNINNVTNRQFLATRELPAPTDGTTISGAGVAIQPYSNTMIGVGGFATVHDHVQRITITPSTLFQLIDGIVNIVPDVDRIALEDNGVTGVAMRANLVNAGNYLYTPFYYVLDSTGLGFRTRVYSMDTPAITQTYFVASNQQLQLDASTTGYSIAPKPDKSGYVFTAVVTGSPDFYAIPIAQLFLQLSFVIPNTTSRIAINGVLISPIDGTTGQPANNYYVYQFDLSTTYDIDHNDLFTLTTSGAPIGLTTAFDLVYIVKDVGSGILPTSVDQAFVKTSIPGYTSSSTYLGLYQENYTIQFGKNLKNLWSRSRSVAAAIEYQKFTTEVMAFYPKDVFDLNPDGTIIIHSTGTPGEIVATPIHRAGDPVLDSGGHQVVLHHIGDPILDGAGLPIPVLGERDILRQIDMLFMDGKYFFANDDASVAYVTEVVSTLADWITIDIANLAQNLLEQSELFYYPKNTAGYLVAYVGNTPDTNSLPVTLRSVQSFVVTLTLTSKNIDNVPLKTALEKVTIATIANALTETTLSRTNIEAALVKVYAGDVVAVKLAGFMGDQFDAVVLTDSSAKPIIGKQLVVMPNLTLQVQDAVEFVYLEI